MANRLFQMARNAVQSAVGRFQGSSNESHEHAENHSNVSGQDMAIAQNALSSAMANSSDAERAQLAELQQELDAQSGGAHANQSATSHQEEQLSSSEAGDLLEDNKLQ
jgi:hypothetical protein